MKDENRATGRTFRVVLQGILKASKGENVIIVCFNEDYARYLFLSSLRILDSYSSSLVHYEKYIRRLNTVKIGKTGSLKFISRRHYFDSKYNWDENHTVSFDHYQGPEI